jgi:hypothetical protein
MSKLAVITPPKTITITLAVEDVYRLAEHLEDLAVYQLRAGVAARFVVVHTLKDAAWLRFLAEFAP